MILKDKNIVLTGASSGIGLEMLSILVSKGAKVIAVARNLSNIPQIDRVYPFSADVSNKDEVDKVFEYALKTLGSIDVFIANAGFAYLEQLKDPDWDHIEEIYKLNVFSPIYSLEKLLKECSTLQLAFVCTISGAGLVSLPGYSLYCSTKAALHHFIQTYRYEQSKGIKITAAYPVATRTSFFDKATGKEGTPLPFPTQTANVVARKIIKGLENGKKKVYPSVLFRLFYPIGRAFPVLLNLYSFIERMKVRTWLDK